MPDPNDVCAMATWLRSAYLALLGGGDPIRVRFADREVWYSQSNITKLETVMLQYEGACDRLQGNAPKRFAMRLGSFR